MQHTPGPWTFDEHDGTFYIFGTDPKRVGHPMVADGDSEEDYISRVRGVGRGATHEEQEANARLIAAAPDLYEACKRALPYLADHIGITLNDGPGDRMAYDLMEAAIAKAEGKP